MVNVSAVACVDRNYGLGYDGKLLYRSSTDMAFFCGLTQGKLVVGGSKTVEGIKYLPNRGMVCLSRNPSNLKDPDKYLMVTQVSKTKEIEELADYTGTDIVVIGGEQIYSKLSDWVEDLYLTVLKLGDEEIKEADSHFPIKLYDHLDMTEVVFENSEMTIYHAFRSR